MAHLILIDEINEKRGSKPFIFPTIDFKFQNSGMATAILWNFTLEILQSDILTQPFLDCTARVSGSTLAMDVENTGWGPAKGLGIRVTDEILTNVFPDDYLSFRGSIDSGEREKVVQIAKDLMDYTAFHRILGQHPDLEAPLIPIGSPGDSLLSGSQIPFSVSLEEFPGQTSSALFHAHPNGTILLGEEGFVFAPIVSHPLIFPSTVTFVALVEPSIGSHKKEYPLSRQIPSGEPERFHIMVGATKSCKLQARFSFSIDSSDVVYSDVFSIEIWNPRNSGWDAEYVDGSEVPRLLSEAEEFEKKMFLEQLKDSPFK